MNRFEGSDIGSRQGRRDVNRRAALGLIAACGASLALAPGRVLASAPAPAPLKYLVFVDGTHSGTYHVEFVPRTGGFTAVSAMSIRIEFAFITAYRYQQDGQEDWHNGRLESFEYLTNDNGQAILVSGSRVGDHLLVNGPNGRATVPGDALSSGFWNAGILACKHLVDPQTAALVPLAVHKLGATTAEIAQRSIHGVAYALQTFLQGTVWYDAHNHLLASSFSQEGHKVELRRA
jgi:Family of unknown function (DUF6134)